MFREAIPPADFMARLDQMKAPDLAEMVRDLRERWTTLDDRDAAERGSRLGMDKIVR